DPRLQLSPVRGRGSGCRVSPSPIAWERIEDAIVAWVVVGSGLDADAVALLEPEASGVPSLAVPCAEVIGPLSKVKLSQPEQRRVLGHVVRRLTITAGAGTV